MTENSTSTADDFGVEEPDSLELERIIATHIALNPERREWRHDIVVSTVVEVLVGGDRTTDELLVAVNRTLRTRTVLAPEFARVLEDAEAAGLIVKPMALSGIERWQVTSLAREEAAEDRAWGKRVYADFEADVARELADDGLDVSTQRAQKAARHLLGALSEGAGNYDVAEGLEGLLHPIDFDRPAVQRALAAVDPRPLRHALLGLAEEAMDPDEPFGNDLVHLLVVSNLLHGFATRRDLPEAARLDGVRVLLDTSALFDLIADGTPEQKLLHDMLELSERAGVEVVVAEHTLDEWERVWVGAEYENPRSHEAENLDPLVDRITRNAFITEFLRRRKSQKQMTWGRFETQARSLRGLLEALPFPVNIRPAGNNTEQDKAVVAAALEKITALSQDPDVPGKRKGRAGAADAEAVAMIARWRDSDATSVRCCAYFVAEDYLTTRAYRELYVGDPHPMTLNVAGWTAYLAATITDDPAEKAALASVMGSAIVRESLFGVATSYTLEEAITLSKLLSEDGRNIAIADARAAIQLDFKQLLDETGERPRDKVNAAAAQLMRNRNARRNERALRITAGADPVSYTHLTLPTKA